MRQGMYRLCRHTVTVYHALYQKDGSFECHRWVIKGVYFELEQSRDTQTSGTRLQNKGLVIFPQQDPLPRWIPGGEFETMTEKKENRYTLQPGDKILLGEHPEVESRQQWTEITPEKVENLLVVKAISVKYFMGEICHIEVS